MNERYPLPRFEGLTLAEYLKDLRQQIFTSQEKAGGYFGLDRTTINRYESGREEKIPPHLGYLLCLIKVIVEGFEDDTHASQQIKKLALQDVESVRSKYYATPKEKIQDWGTLCLLADTYLLEQRKRKTTEQPKIPELTFEEHEVMRLVVVKCTREEISGRMHLSPDYIRELLTNSIFPKLNARNIAEAEQRYIELFGYSVDFQQSDLPDKRHYPLWRRWAHILSAHSISTLTVCYCMCLPIFLIIWVESPRDCQDCILNFYANTYLIIALVGSGLGFAKLFNHYWSFKNFPVPIVFACLALLSWAIGNMTWMYNNFKYGDSVPYPSLGDRLYLTNNVLWIIGVYWLQRALGATHVRKTFMLLVVGITMGVGLVTLMWMLRNGQPHPDDPEKFFFDVSFPLTSGMTFALARLWRTDPSFNQLDRMMKKSVRWTFWGIVFLFFADLGFSIGTLVPNTNPLVYFNGGWQDFCFATGFYCLGCGILFMSLQSTEQVMTIEQLIRWLVKIVLNYAQRLSDVLIVLKTAKNKTPEFDVFKQHGNPFIRCAKLIAQLIMTLNLFQ